MHEMLHTDKVRVARRVGWAMLASIGIGILSAIFISAGIDINLSADVEATARNMLDAEQRLRAKAYVSILSFALAVLVAFGLYLLLYGYGRLLAGWSLAMAVGAALLGLTGAVYTMNVAEIASHPAYLVMTSEAQNLMLSALQATSSYTAFHLALIMASAANAGFFYLFLRSRQIPVIISGWGLFASLFVATTIVARDFIPALGNDVLTLAFMISNLVAMLALGLFLAFKGLRPPS